MISNDIDILVKSIRASVPNDLFNLIAIDGEDGSGKTTITRIISKETGISYVSLDDERYLSRNQGGFKDHINKANLRHDMNCFLKLKKPVIVEGICILEIIRSIGFKENLHIYIKKLSSNSWESEMYYDYSSTKEVILAKIARETEQLFQPKSEDLYSAKVNFGDEQQYNEEISETEVDYPTLFDDGIFVEIIDFHFKYQPDKTANIVFQWNQYNT